MTATLLPKITGTSIWSAVFLGMLTIIPFVVLELVNGQDLQNGFPAALFVFLWFLASVLALAVGSITHSFRAGKDIFSHPLTFLFGFIVVAIIAAVWLTVVADQMPCFLGVPNCD